MQPNRRQLLAGLAAPLVFGSLRANAAEKLNVAAVGTGGRCTFLMEEVLRQGDNIVALCDVDRNQIDAARTSLAGKGDRFRLAMERARIYNDYRKLLDADSGYDAVLIATGSRWHAILATLFLQAGKHVYCEKPLVHRLTEARDLAELARTSPLTTQTGTQGGSGKAFRRSVEAIQAGLLGQVRSVYLWCDGYGPNPPSHDRPAGSDPVPAGLNWDFWLGPAPLRPFKKSIYHPGCIAFQNWFDLCNGMLAGQGAHQFYLPVLALDLPAPTRVTPVIPEPVRETYVSKGCFTFEFPARGKLAPVTLWWGDGGKYPPEEVTASVKALGGKVPNMGCLFVGEKGELFAGGWGEGGLLKLKGDKSWRGVLDHEAVKSVPVRLPRAPDDNHMLEWLQACKAGRKTFTRFEVGARVSSVYLPGIVALRLGRPIDWNGAALEVPGEPGAKPFIATNYRRRWLV